MKTKLFTALIILWTTVLFAQDGILKWRYKTGGGVTSSPSIGADGMVYVGSKDHYLYALNPNGSLKWRYETGDIVNSSPSIDADGTVYVGSYDHYLYALNPDGSLKWRYKTGYWIPSSPSIGADGTVYVGSYDDYLYALNPDGSLKWRYKTGDCIFTSSPSIGGDGTVYVGSKDDYLYALNPDGTLKWRYVTSGSVYSSPSIGADGTVYVGSNDNYLYALNPDGTLKWWYKTGDNVYSSPSIGADGTVYVGSYDDNLYALNPDGTLKWRYVTSGSVYSSPSIGADGTVYVGSLDDYIYALNPDGTLKWWYKTGSSVYSSPSIGADGTVYVGCDDNYLYAIETICGGLAESPWPMRGNNARHRGLYQVPFYCSDSFMFQALAGDYAGVMCLMGQNMAAQVTSCRFTHPAFALNASLPITVAIGQDVDLNFKIMADSCTIYNSKCTLGWQTSDKSGEISFSLSQGIIYKDGSEADVVGSQVLTAYDSSFAKDPESIATKNNLALLFRICGEPERADQILSGIEEDALDDYYCADVYLLNRGVTQSDLNKPDTAAIYFSGVLSNESEAMSAKAWYNSGWEAFQKDDYHRVMTCTDSVLASSMVSDYTLAKAWCLRGAALFGLGQKKDAQAAFTQAENLDPNGPIGAMARENLLTGVDDNEDKIIPARFELYANYPNPFNPFTTIDFNLPQAGEVTISIYNTLGRLVRRLHQGHYSAGRHTLKWNALDDNNRAVSSGVYLLKVTTNNEIKVKKLTLMR